VPGGGGDEAVEQARGLDLVAPTEGLDNALNMSPSLADILDEVEVLITANLLDTHEHRCCPD
jgi:hypothetical protein